MVCADCHRTFGDEMDTSRGICPNCKEPWELPGYDRPTFTCDKCGVADSRVKHDSASGINLHAVCPEAPELTDRELHNTWRDLRGVWSKADWIDFYETLKAFKRRVIARSASQGDTKGK